MYFDVILKKNPVFSFEIPGPALVLLPIFHQITYHGLRKRINQSIFFSLKIYHTVHRRKPRSKCTILSQFWAMRYPLGTVDGDDAHHIRYTNLPLLSINFTKRLSFCKNLFNQHVHQFTLIYAILGQFIEKESRFSTSFLITAR